MALVGNRAVISKTPGVFRSGTTLSADRNNFANPSQARNRYVGGFNPKNGTPTGHLAPSSWVLPQKAGGLSSSNILVGFGTLTGSGARGVNGEAGLTGSGDLSAALELIVSAIATLTGSGVVTGTAQAILNAAAALAGSGNLTGAVGALADLPIVLFGSGTLSSTPAARGFMSAAITPFTELSPQSLSAQILDQEDVETGMTVREALRVIAAATAGKISGAGGTTVTIRNAVADSKDRIVATVDTNGNRSVVAVDLT